MNIDYTAVLAYGLGIILLFILGRMLVVPLKFVMKLVYNALIGGAVLILINLIGGFFNYHMPVNFITAMITGLLGVPGIILLIILKQIFKV